MFILGLFVLLLSYYFPSDAIRIYKRRVRGDLIEVFKLLKGFDKVDYNKFFQINQRNRTRGHSLKLNKSRSRTDIRKNFFRLPQNVVDADSVTTFKNRLDGFESYDCE